MFFIIPARPTILPCEVGVDGVGISHEIASVFRVVFGPARSCPYSDLTSGKLADFFFDVRGSFTKDPYRCIGEAAQNRFADFP